MYTNGTTNYNLPQYVDSDKATWTDLNAPFNQIDAAIKGAVDDTAQEALDIDALKTRMDTAEQNIGTNTTDIAGLDTRLTTAEGAITSQASQIADVKQDTEDMICAYNEASATSTHRYEVGDYFIYNDVLYKATQVIAIGDTIVPDTNCSTTNVTTELLTTENLSDEVTQLQTDVGQLQTDVGQLQTDVGQLQTDIEHSRVVWTSTPNPSGTIASELAVAFTKLREIIGTNYNDALKYAIVPSQGETWTITHVTADENHCYRAFLGGDYALYIDSMSRTAASGTHVYRTQTNGASGIAHGDTSGTAYTGTMSLVLI